jgi:integrase/recombinase XerD
VTKFARHFNRSTGSAGFGGRSGFSSLPGITGHFLAGAQSDGLRLALFYGVTLNRAEIPERIAYARTPRKLPTILSAD